MRAPFLTAACATATAFASAPAVAAPIAEAVSRVGIIACNGRAGAHIAPSDLAGALLASVSIDLLDRAAGDRVGLVRKLAVDGPPLRDDDPLKPIQATLQAITATLAQKLGNDTLPTLSARAEGDTRIAGPDQLFGPPDQVILICKSAEDGTKPKAAPSRLAIRGSIEELTLIGDAVKSAGAFTLGYQRNNSRLNGVSTRTNTFTAKGAVGFVLNRSAFNPLLAYVDYSRKRVRTRTDPAPAMSDPQGAGDIDAIQFGLTGSRFIPNVGAGSLVLSGQTGVIFDRRKDSSRLSGGLVLSPRIDRAVRGVCGLYGPEDVEIGPIRFSASCRPAFLAEGAHVLRTGRATFGAADDLLATGAEFHYAIAPHSGEDSGPVGGVLLRYLPVISGQAPDLSVFEAEIGYRWWADETLGIDFKLSYHDGVERKSLAHEKIVAAGFGLIF